MKVKELIKNLILLNPDYDLKSDMTINQIAILVDFVKE